MAISQKEVSKTINLDLEKVPQAQRESVKKDVGDFVVNEILRFVETGISPVKGEGKFKALNKKYADKEKNGNRKANLELDGDMLDALTFEITGNGIEVGVFNEKETPKAFNHNTGDTLPKRQFIPNEDQGFKRRISSGINDIIRNRERSTTTRRTEVSSLDDFTFTTTQESPEGIEIFNSNIDSIIRDIFGTN